MGQRAVMKSNSLVKLLYAVEAAGYATAGSCETSAEWHAAAVARWRHRHGSRLARRLASTSSMLMSVLLAMFFVTV
jgi:hypothetical protein